MTFEQLHLTIAASTHEQVDLELRDGRRRLGFGVAWIADDEHCEPCVEVCWTGDIASGDTLYTDADMDGITIRGRAR